MQDMMLSGPRRLLGLVVQDPIQKYNYRPGKVCCSRNPDMEKKFSPLWILPLRIVVLTDQVAHPKVGNRPCLGLQRNANARPNIPPIK